jgi:hypothetical protein
MQTPLADAASTDAVAGLTATQYTACMKSAQASCNPIIAVYRNFVALHRARLQTSLIELVAIGAPKPENNS